MCKKHITKKELAALLGVSTGTINNWMREEPPCPCLFIGRRATGSGRRPRFELERVMEWLESRTEAGKHENANGKELEQ